MSLHNSVDYGEVIVIAITSSLFESIALVTTLTGG